ncbi:MAG: hypothetical protein LC676_10790 [Loktanella sp.]|nr:hypothetical protein [Loktanella sp.]
MTDDKCFSVPEINAWMDEHEYIMASDLISTAAGLFGDGDGGEIGTNPEYERGQIELVLNFMGWSSDDHYDEVRAAIVAYATDNRAPPPPTPGDQRATTYTITIAFDVDADDLREPAERLTGEPSRGPQGDLVSLIQSALYDDDNGPSLAGQFTVITSHETPGGDPAPGGDPTPFAFAEGFDQPEGDLTPEGVCPPFVVFVPSIQDHMPILFGTKTEAETMARILCATKG